MDPEERKAIERLTSAFPDNRSYFIETLAHGVGTIAAAFYPKDVVVRMSDFKSNEYANLLGGKYFEPDERNPMLGLRGASRYYSDRYREAYGLECQALKMVRDEMRADKRVPMIPSAVEWGAEGHQGDGEERPEVAEERARVYIDVDEKPIIHFLIDDSQVYRRFLRSLERILLQLTLGDLTRDSEILGRGVRMSGTPGS